MIDNARLFKVCYEPLGVLKPAFYSTGYPLESNTYPESLLTPSVLTLSGAFLNLIRIYGNVDPTYLEDLILNDSLVINGVYLTEVLNESNTRNLRIILLPVYALILKDGSISLSTLSIRSELSRYIKYGDLESYAKSLPLDYRKESERILLFAELHVTGRIINLFKVRTVREERLCVSLERLFKSTISPKDRDHLRRLFSYIGMVELNLYSYTTGKGFYLIERPAYCIEVKLHVKNEEVSKIVNIVRDICKEKPIQNLGGEGGLAKVHIKEVRDLSEPTLNSLINRVQRSTYRLATSHIPVSYVDHGLVTTLNEYIDSYLGEISLIGGWYLKKNIPKPSLWTLTPGTIYKTSKQQVPEVEARSSLTVALENEEYQRLVKLMKKMLSSRVPIALS